jgi:hypothetical protein
MKIIKKTITVAMPSEMRTPLGAENRSIYYLEMAIDMKAKGMYYLTTNHWLHRMKDFLEFYDNEVEIFQDGNECVLRALNID